VGEAGGTAPRVVALGGGHGLAVALRAIRRYASDVTAIVSVADDGGSSGRLRRELGGLPPGDLRRCLGALVPDGSLWPTVLEHRFERGALAGHTVGNLLLEALVNELGSWTSALDAAGDLLGATGRVLPATSTTVVLGADVDGMHVEGQVAVQHSHGRKDRVELVPPDAPPTPAALSAIASADQVVLAPGSLYTSLLPVLCVRDVGEAVAKCDGQVVQVCNLGPEVPETEGLDAVDHLRAVLDHGCRVDVFLVHRGSTFAPAADEAEPLGVRVRYAGVAAPSGTQHDPGELARALADLLESG
jgi:uncharacterized cofD-like protein